MIVNSPLKILNRQSSEICFGNLNSPTVITRHVRGFENIYTGFGFKHGGELQEFDLFHFENYLPTWCLATVRDYLKTEAGGWLSVFRHFTKDGKAIYHGALLTDENHRELFRFHFTDSGSPKSWDVVNYFCEVLTTKG